MVTDQQVRRLKMLIKAEKSLSIAASKAGMDEKTGRKYLRLGKLPSENMIAHTWRTREDPFKDTWEEIRDYLEVNPGLEAKTIFEFMQRNKPDMFSDGQLRTLQRKIKTWRALSGPAKEVFFPQEYRPGELCESDFTHMTDLGITINKELFQHMIYHFVLCYSNWENGTVCFSESYESLSEGLQNALWELGGVPGKHRTDRLSAAIHKDCNPDVFTDRYNGLLGHYKMIGARIQAGKANENGDIEQRHHRFKNAVKQEIMIRGSHDFSSRKEYCDFLKSLFARLNSGRKNRLKEELIALRELPAMRLNSCKKIIARVGPGSTIQVLHNTYSVASRLIKERVEVRIYAEYLEIWYAQKKVDTIARIRGEYKHAVNYRHIIDWLVRKPGAFQDYRYRHDMFPTTIFRMAYDQLIRNNPATGHKRYLEILYLAAKETEIGVQQALEKLLGNGEPVTIDGIKLILGCASQDKMEIAVNHPDLALYDEILTTAGAV